MTLSKREIEILTLLATGLKPWEVARALNIAPHTIKNQLLKVREKLGAKTTIQAVVIALRGGFITLSSKG